jgi:S-adenosylmethionine/arginine decarboxylase-like enzyme
MSDETALEIEGLRDVLDQPGAFSLDTQIELGRCDLGRLNNSSWISDSLLALCRQLDMKPYGLPRVTYFGEGALAGWTGDLLITTSNIWTHCVPADHAAFWTVSSCKTYQPGVAADFIAGRFGARDVVYSHRVRRVPRPRG